MRVRIVFEVIQESLFFSPRITQLLLKHNRLLILQSFFLNICNTIFFQNNFNYLKNI